jgi:tetratricopeptide (TPR) repeat protein
MAKKNKPSETLSPNATSSEMTTSSAARSGFMQQWLLPLLLAFASVLLYSNTFHHRFVLDDHGIIKNNKITKAAVSMENTKTIFSTPLRKGDVSDLENSLYRPAIKLLYNLEWNAFDGNPHSFHVVNVLLYALCCFLLYLVLYEAFSKRWVIPFLITLLFAVHPLHVESVANVKGGEEVLSLLGLLLALRCAQLYLHKSKTLYFVLAILAYLVASFSKESTVVAVAIIPLFLYYFTKATVKQNLMLSGSFLACSVFFLVCRHFALSGYPEPLPTSVMDNYLVACESKAEQVASAINTLGLYLKTFFIPHPLSCDYSFKSLEPVTLSSPYFLLSFVLFVAMFAFAVYKLKQKEGIGFGILWFFISISIVSNIFFLIGTSFGERLMFTPSLGLCIAFILLLAKYLYKPGENTLSEIKTSPILFGIVIVVSGIFAAKTYARNMDWKTDFKLFSRDIEHYPESTHLLFYMGNHLSGNERKEVLNYEMNEMGFTPQQIADSAAKENLKSIEYFNRSLGIFPALPSDGYNQLGKAYYNCGLLDSAQKYYVMAFDLDKTNGIFINNMGTVYYQQAALDVRLINAAGQRGQIDSANYYYNRRVTNVVKSRGYFVDAFKKDPTEPDFTNNIACTYGDLGILDSAAYWFEKSVALDPIDTTALKFLEITYRNMKEEAKAKSAHDKYMQAKSEHLALMSE